MSKPNFDESQGDPDENFNFLHERSGGNAARSAGQRRRKTFDMPIIRKPVPIAESGPMRVESSGLAQDYQYPGNPRSAQRPAADPHNEVWNDGLHVDDAHRRSSGVKKFAVWLFAMVLLAGAALAYTAYLKIGPTEIAATDNNLPGATELDTPLDPAPEIASTPAETTAAIELLEPTAAIEPVVAIEPDVANEQTSAIDQNVAIEPVDQSNSLFNQFNEKVSLLESLLANNELDEAERIISTMDRAVYGYGASEFTGFEQRIAKQRTGESTELAGSTETETATLVAPLPAPLPDEQLLPEEQLSDEQQLLEAQQLAEEQRLAEVKRMLDEERAAEQERLVNEQRAAEATQQAEAQRVAEEVRLANEARAVEQAQLMIEQALVAEQALAAEQALEAEQALAAEQALEAEQALAAEQALEAEQALAAEQALEAERARETEQARLAERERLSEQSRLAEQARLAEVERLSAEEVTPNLTEQQRQAALAQAAEESLALATAKAEERIIEERARLIREADAEFARNQAQEQESERIRAEEALVNQPTASEPASASISDDDFNFVAGKFFELKTAVTNKDIDSVIALTKPSGKRIQQMLQIFENSSSVEARVSNVATRNADGVIVGQLKIQKVIKNSGAVATVPSNLSSITLTSERGPEGWSAIAW